MNIGMIKDTIKELEKEEPTFAMCQKLASLYIVRDHFSGDYVEGSNIDECIQLMLNLFVTYYNSKSVETLQPLLITLNQIISELYHTCPTIDEQTLIKKFILALQKIVV